MVKLLTIIQNGVGLQVLDLGREIEIVGLTVSVQAQGWFEIDFDGATTFSPTVDLDRIEFFLSTGFSQHFPINRKVNTLTLNQTFGAGRVFLVVHYKDIEL